MANEIAILDRDPNEGRGRVLFLYAIASPKQVLGVNVVPTPSANLPDLAKLVLAQDEKDALDAGTMAFEIVSVSVPTTLTAQQIAAALKAKWATANARFQLNYGVRFGYTGTRLNAP